MSERWEFFSGHRKPLREWAHFRASLPLDTCKQEMRLPLELKLGQTCYTDQDTNYSMVALSYLWWSFVEYSLNLIPTVIYDTVSYTEVKYTVTMAGCPVRWKVLGRMEIELSKSKYEPTTEPWHYPGFGWNRVRFPPSSWHSAMLWI